MEDELTFSNKVVNWNICENKTDTYFKMDEILKTFNTMLTRHSQNNLQ